MPDPRTYFLTAAGLGAGAMYFLDPGHGARRRARARNVCAHLTHQTSNAAATTTRDVRHRLQGIVASLRSAVRYENVDDEVLKERVRSTMGHHVSHSHAVQVGASNGVVTLKGLILEEEAAGLIRTIRRVRGVRQVIDALERHERGARAPALQGGQVPAGGRLDILRSHWGPATRVLMGTVGATLAWSSVSREGLLPRVRRLIGLGLFTRAATNVPVGQMATMGWRNHAVTVQKTIAIDAPVGEVYAFWSLYDRFPQFMSRVLDVTSSDSRPMESHWKVLGPASVPVEFNVEVVGVIPNQMIAWRTLEGSAVRHDGSVRFDPEGARRTRIHVRMSYVPPAGWLGHGVASLFGVDPKSSLDEDLVRMKSLIETGHAPRDAARPMVAVRAH